MYKIELVALLSLMTIALGFTYFIGYKLKKDYIINYKYSIFTVIIYNLVLLLLGVEIERLQIALENLLGGRFIKFRDRGRDYYQFIFNLES